MSFTNLLNNSLINSGTNILRSYASFSLRNRSFRSKLSLFRSRNVNVFQPLFDKLSPQFHSSARRFAGAGQPVEDADKPMVKITFITSKGEEVEIQGRVGLTVMQEAIRNNLPMQAACEGQLACTTCHVYVEECERKDSSSQNPYLEGLSMEEDDLLESAPHLKANSRLSCQLTISEECENVKFRLPAATVNFQVDKKDRV